MAIVYNPEKFHVDFSSHPNLSKSEKEDLQKIQETYRPMERVEYLTQYRIEGKLTDDEFEQLTGVPYNFE